jgi:hypothetical protein
MGAKGESAGLILSGQRKNRNFRSLVVYNGWKLASNV